MSPPGSEPGGDWIQLWGRIGEQQEDLVNGRARLVLPPRRLALLAGRLRRLGELMRQRQAAPVEYFRAFAIDIGDYRVLAELETILSNLKLLRVCPVRRGLDPSPVDLSPFKSLQSLELHWCELVTAPPTGLQALRCTLQQLVCTGPLPSLHYLLVGPDSTTEAVDDAAPWPRLLHLACENSAVTRMDASMALLPAVQILNLSRACIDEVEYAERCVRLDCLNLSFNRFRSVRSLPTRLGAVKRLVLRGNELESTVGLERLYALEGIDLASNLIIAMEEVARLASLPCLTALWLEGNPITYDPNYRPLTLSYFPQPPELRLDGRSCDRPTIATAHRLASARQQTLGAMKSKQLTAEHAGAIAEDTSVEAGGGDRNNANEADIAAKGGDPCNPLAHGAFAAEDTHSVTSPEMSANPFRAEHPRAPLSSWRTSLSSDGGEARATEAERMRASILEFDLSSDLQKRGMTPHPMSATSLQPPSWMLWGWGQLKRRVLERLPNKVNPPHYQSSVLDVVQSSDLPELALEDSDNEDLDSCSSSSASSASDVEPPSATSTALTLDTNYAFQTPSSHIFRHNPSPGTHSSLAFHLPPSYSQSLTSNRMPSFEATTPPQFKLDDEQHPPEKPETTGRDAAAEWMAAHVERGATLHPLSGRHSLPSQWSTDTNVQLMFRLRVRPSGSGETCSHCFRCDYVSLVHDGGAELQETAAVLLASDQALYVCDMHTLEVLFTHSLADPLSLEVGLGRELCALREVGDACTHLLVFRDRILTTAFLDCLTAAYVACGNGARLTLRSLESEQLARLLRCVELNPAASALPPPAAASSLGLPAPLMPDELLLYTMVHQWTPQESGDPDDGRSANGWTLTPRTLVMSQSDVILLEHDLMHFGNSQPEHSDGYTVAACQPMLCVARVLLPEGFTLRSSEWPHQDTDAAAKSGDGFCQGSPTAALTLLFTNPEEPAAEVRWRLELGATAVTRVVMLLAERACAN